MSPLDTRRTAPGVSGNGPHEACRATRYDAHIDKRHREKAQALDAARRDLDAITDDLDIIADWKADLFGRIARAQLHFELIGLEPDEHEDLVAEACDFCRLCRAMAWRPKP